jgi:hypothetical protein
MVLCGSVLVGSGLMGCGSAQIFSQDTKGGVISVAAFDDDSMDKAVVLMEQHCGKGHYRILARDSILVGSENYAQSNTNYGERTDKAKDGVAVSSGPVTATSEDSTKVTQGGSETTAVSGVRPVYDKRVTYECAP